MEARPEPVEVPEVAPPEPIPEVIPLPDDYQLVMISLVSEGGHPIQVAPPAPLDSIPLTIEAPPAPTEEPKMMVETGFSDQELAIAAEQYRQVSDQPDPPDVPKTNGNGKVKHLCPGPKCRRVSRKGSPYCSTVCKDRCYRLRKKAFRAILTEAETTRLHRILVALEAWYGEAGDGGVVETPSPKSAAPV
jgi:hypothetical protein